MILQAAVTELVDRSDRAQDIAAAGVGAVGEWCNRLGVVEELDAAVGPIKQHGPASPINSVL